jgi:hypothetical protein
MSPEPQHLADLAFGGLAVAYLWFGSKVEEWVTLTELGVRTKTPASFVDHPGVYDAVRIALFLGAALCLFATTWMPWYLGALILLAAWLATSVLGMRQAFATSRTASNNGIDGAEAEESRTPAVSNL